MAVPNLTQEEIESAYLLGKQFFSLKGYRATPQDLILSGLALQGHPIYFFDEDDTEIILYDEVRLSEEGWCFNLQNRTLLSYDCSLGLKEIKVPFSTLLLKYA